jgi:hypothetical protein
MQDQDNALAYKKVYDQHQKQFVKVRSLVDIAADVVVPSQLMPVCAQLSGSNVDSLGKEIIENQLHLPDELRPLIISKLLTHASDQEWKIRFREKKEEEKKKLHRSKTLYVDKDICIKQFFLPKTRARPNNVMVKLIDIVKVENLSKKLFKNGIANNGLIQGIVACFNKGDHLYQDSLKAFINETVQPRATLCYSFQRFYRSCDGKLLVGLPMSREKNSLVFTSDDFGLIQELDMANTYIDHFAFLENEVSNNPLLLIGCNLQREKFLMWQYDEKKEQFLSLEPGIENMKRGFKTESINFVKDNETAQNILVSSIQSNYYPFYKALIFYEHIETNVVNSAENPYWLPIQRIENIKDFVFSADKKTCVTLLSDLKTVNFYQRIDSEWRVISTITLEKKMRCLRKLREDFLVASPGGNSNYYIDSNTGKIVTSFVEHEKKNSPVFDVPYELILASIAKSNDYKKQDQKSLEQLLSSDVFKSDLHNDSLDAYKEQLTEKTEAAIRRSSVALRFAKFCHEGSFWRLGFLGWGMSSLVLYRHLSSILTEENEFSCFTMAVFGGGLSSVLAVYGIARMTGIDDYDSYTESDLRWLNKKKAI